jgi:3-oxoacyl-[acyl-carrier-protein] synthase II
LRAALDDAGLGPEQIDYYNAHATATRGGDPVETAAVREVFGNAAQRLPVSSSKSIHGHLLGAASAMELAVTVLAVGEAFLPATAHLDEVDPECRLNHVANQPVLEHHLQHAMSLSAGFGGTNVALVVSKEHDLPTRPRVAAEVFT